MTEDEIIAQIRALDETRQMHDDCGDLDEELAESFDKRIAELRRELHELQTPALL